MDLGTRFRIYPAMVGILACVCVAGTGHATDVQHRFADFSKVPEPFAPTGVETAGINVLPVLRGETFFETDALPQRTEDAEDAGARLTPEIALTHESWRHKIAINLLGSYEHRFMEEDESVLEFDTNLHASAVPWGGGRMYLDVGYLNDHIDRGDPDELDGNEPTPMYATPVRLGWRQRGTKLGFHVGYFFTDFNHNDPPIRKAGDPNLNATVMDHEEWGWDGEFDGDISSVDTLFVRGRYYESAFDNADPAAGRNIADVNPDEFIDRSGTGWRAAVGNRFKKDNGIEGEAFIGWMNRTFDDSRRANVSGIDLGLTLAWPFADKYTFNAAIDRSVEETRVPDASAFARTFAEAGIDYQWREDVVFGADLGTVLRDFKGLDRDDTVYRAGLDATWYLDRSFHASAGLSYERQASDRGVDFDRTRAVVGFSAQM